MTEPKGPAALISTLSLTEDAPDRFVAPLPLGEGRIFGGQVAAQALKAACMTVDPGRLPHSLHLYFIRRGRGGVDLSFLVERSRDGRTFSARHVTALQEGKPILEMMVSFQTPEDAPEREYLSIPDVPDPETLEPLRLGWLAGSAFDLRPTKPQPEGVPPWHIHPFWIRVRSDIERDPTTDACVLVYLSDIGFMGVAAIPEVKLNPMGAGSLDHAVWFHRPYDPTEWLLYCADPISNSSARGFATASLFDRQGRLVASLAQEALLRPE